MSQGTVLLAPAFLVRHRYQVPVGRPLVSRKEKEKVPPLPKTRPPTWELSIAVLGAPRPLTMDGIYALLV
ncbi:hypothetical protein M406DRAFT_103881 [Cryphonectria parasitica EP155]|uniref:Uncharacterized protein n=1 Tax=Cryphonectria parasitica (strain ATCC 38755 / EP155) TaxID=660469 RepID=A0A9P4XZG0_CRYP1|nr:uncharacterized protein M406DRAFT_103881 [Cryphonectria parasitica EP155]KAF3763602.1 hypothetical protein M406DRAFT_103881 [Cryphonectria parasitica EP155]